MLQITAVFAILLTLIGSYLAFRAGSLRGRTKVSIGDGGDTQLLLEMRRHGNFAEFVPMALILMAIVELNGGNAGLLYGCGGLLVVARVLHPIGLQPGEEGLSN
ncbi:MAG: MAPEG family protein, partial [Proteobacteria bacterium]|nr:MAPEG family protein [Pseudomonadota bacterium]